MQSKLYSHQFLNCHTAFSTRKETVFVWESPHIKDIHKTSVYCITNSYINTALIPRACICLFKKWLGNFIWFPNSYGGHWCICLAQGNGMVCVSKYSGKHSNTYFCTSGKICHVCLGATVVCGQRHGYRHGLTFHMLWCKSKAVSVFLTIQYLANWKTTQSRPRL